MSGRFSENQVKQSLVQGEIKTVADIQSALKDLFGQTLQAMLEGEMDNHLGYPKGDGKSKQTDNRRNGHGQKASAVPMARSTSSFHATERANSSR